jgi:hypothetical protein
MDIGMVGYIDWEISVSVETTLDFAATSERLPLSAPATWVGNHTVDVLCDGFRGRLRRLSLDPLAIRSIPSLDKGTAVWTTLSVDCRI